MALFRAYVPSPCHLRKLKPDFVRHNGRLRFHVAAARWSSPTRLTRSATNGPFHWSSRDERGNLGRADLVQKHGWACHKTRGSTVVDVERHDKAPGETALKSAQ